MKKNIILSLCFMLLITMFIFINPYEMYHHVKAEERISNLFGDPSVRENVFGDDSVITNIEYVGSNMYRLEIKNNAFVIKIKSKGSRTSYEVFELKHSIDQFGY
ncbi:hypothetical protein [Alkalihalobacterium chitinilyticum]|uniref:DUF3139 domain-containing protein n=1 Tax=Alkalihalobacterium chitinilyticum TaxID=2980103 RepID=A0ABT5VGH4_9BACI|nr:hypothetical protein [Alkalihalobacterium chitinilyticum]MDE5414271.1 hypothetical protein [Alkalihalobacterium chitinilyticum]